MSEYVNGATDILGGSVIRYSLNTTTPNQAVIRKVIAGSGITISSTGVDSGTGDVTVSISGIQGSGGTGGGPGVGTVTSVNMIAPTGMFVQGAPITTAGTISLRLSSGYIVPLYTDVQLGITGYNRSVVSALVTGTVNKTLTLTRQDGSTVTAVWEDISSINILSTESLVSDYDTHITGSRNSVNKIFTLRYAYTSGSTRVFVNGIRYSPGALNDYTESAVNQITFTNAPDDGDVLVVDYIKS